MVWWCDGGIFNVMVWGWCDGGCVVLETSVIVRYR